MALLERVASVESSHLREGLLYYSVPDYLYWHLELSVTCTDTSMAPEKSLGFKES